MTTPISSTAYSRWQGAAIAAASALAFLLAIIAVIGAWEAFPDVVLVVAVILSAAAAVGALLRSMAWHFLALIGAAIACAGAYLVMAHAMSRIAR